LIRSNTGKEEKRGNCRALVYKSRYARPEKETWKPGEEGNDHTTRKAWKQTLLKSDNHMGGGYPLFAVWTPEPKDKGTGFKKRRCTIQGVGETESPEWQGLRGSNALLIISVEKSDLSTVTGRVNSQKVVLSGTQKTGDDERERTGCLGTRICAGQGGLFHQGLIICRVSHD